MPMKRLILIPATLLCACACAFGQNQPPIVTPAAADEPAAPLAPKRPKPAPTPAIPNHGGGVGGGGDEIAGGAVLRSPIPNYGGGRGGGGVFYSAGAVGLSSSSAGIPPVVVRFSGGGDETIGPLEEDLNIMTHVIERSLQNGLGEDVPEVKSGIRLLYSEGGRSVRGMFLEGFGAMFMIKVRFPLFAPSAPEPKEPPATSDSEWDKAKQELYSEADGRSAEVALVAGGSQFDSEQVEQLKKVVLQSLKSASNIHNLKSDDFVAVTVFGQPSAVAQVKKSRSKSATSTPSSQNQGTARPETAAPRKTTLDLAADANDRVVDPLQSRVPRKVTSDLAAVEEKVQALARLDILRTSSQGTVLAMRVKKSDVDAFASGKLDFDAFEKKVEQHSYPGNGYGVSSINSWSKSRGSSGALAK